MISKIWNNKSFFIIFSFWISNKQNETRTTKLRFFPLNDVVQRLRHTHICIFADCTDVSCRCELPANSRTVIGSSPQQPSLQRPLVSRGVWCFPVQLKWSRLGSAWREWFIQSGLFFPDFWPFCLSFSLHVPLVSVFTWSRLVLMFRYVGRVPTCPRLSSNHLRAHLLACTSDICMALARCKHTSGRSVLMLFLLHSLRLWLRTRSSAADRTGSDMLDVQRENLFLTIFNLGHIRVIWKFPACINLTVSFWFASALMSSLFLVSWFECQEEVKGGSCL